MTAFGTMLAAVVLIAPQNSLPSSTTLSGMLASPYEAQQAVVHCGLPATRVRVQYETDMQEDVVWIAREPKTLASAVLDCIARASLKTSYYVYFRDNGEQMRYIQRYTKIEDETDILNARTWLKDRNLLSRMPVPTRGKPISGYAAAVEAFCGVKQGTLLVARDAYMMTPAEGGLGKLTDKGVVDAAATEAQFECVSKTIAAADLRSKGLFFGFIGNAAERDR